MIAVGVFMAVATGLAVCAHCLLLGYLTDAFIGHDISLQILNAANATNTWTTEYFCSATESPPSAKLDEFLSSSDPGGLLLSEMDVFALSYFGLAAGVLIASFISSFFWNLSAYWQTCCLRQAFFLSIIRQEIGWFDVNPSAQLNSRLSEWVCTPPSLLLLLPSLTCSSLSLSSISFCLTLCCFPVTEWHFKM